MVQTMAVNAVAPFVLCSRLQPILAPSVFPGATLFYVAFYTEYYLSSTFATFLSPYLINIFIYTYL